MQTLANICSTVYGGHAVDYQSLLPSYLLKGSMCQSKTHETRNGDQDDFHKKKKIFIYIFVQNIW